MTEKVYSSAAREAGARHEVSDRMLTQSVTKVITRLLSDVPGTARRVEEVTRYDDLLDGFIAVAAGRGSSLMPKGERTTQAQLDNNHLDLALRPRHLRRASKAVLDSHLAEPEKEELLAFLSDQMDLGREKTNPIHSENWKPQARTAEEVLNSPEDVIETAEQMLLTKLETGTNHLPGGYDGPVGEDEELIYFALDPDRARSSLLHGLSIGKGMTNIIVIKQKKGTPPITAYAKSVNQMEDEFVIDGQGALVEDIQISGLGSAQIIGLGAKNISVTNTALILDDVQASFVHVGKYSEFTVKDSQIGLLTNEQEGGKARTLRFTNTDVQSAALEYAGIEASDSAFGTITGEGVFANVHGDVDTITLRPSKEDRVIVPTGATIDGRTVSAKAFGNGTEGSVAITIIEDCQQKEEYNGANITSGKKLLN